MSFIDSIKERARKDKKTIVLPESMDGVNYCTYRAGICGIREK